MSAVDTYIQWIVQHGGKFSKLDFRNDSDNVGSVYANDTVQENEAFATVPFRIAITEPVARKAFPMLEGFSCRTVLSLFLVQQKLLGNQSFYAPYLDILPDHIMTPFFYNDEDLHYLTNTNIANTVKERKQAIYQDYERALQVLADTVNKQEYTWERFLWAYSVLSSRAFPYSLVDPQHTEGSEVLFPLLDALNHKPNTKITWVRSGDEETGTLTFVSGQQVAAGEQMYNNYGPKSNEELLLGYGFCFERNEHDHVALKPNFSMDPNHELKLNILSRCHVQSSHEDGYTYFVHRGNIPDEFFKLMRVLMMNPMELMYYSSCNDSQLLSFVGFRNELAMLSTTRALLQSRLQAIKSVALDRQNATWWQKFALMYRDGQEDILNYTLSAIENMKQRTIHRMMHALNNNIHPEKAPFISILNPTYCQAVLEEGSSETNSLITLDNVVITLKQMLDKDKAFKDAVTQVIDDAEENEDVLFMLALIRERANHHSRWKFFFDLTTSSEQFHDEESQMEMQELHASLFPALTEECPDIFPAHIFTVDALLWADFILNNYSIDNPLAIVPL